MSCPVILENITKSFGSLKVLNGLDTCIEAGTFTAILGPSGCGKSTLLHILSGLLPPDTGRVRVNGGDITGVPGQVGFMQQKDLLLPWKRVIENVAVPLVLRGTPRREAEEAVRPYLETFGLAGFEHAWPAELSGGMRQRAALLRTYMFRRDVLLLDEPFGALDAITRKKMQFWLRRLIRSFDSTVVFVTHDVDEALLLSSRIIVLSDRPAEIRLDMPVSIPSRRDEETLMSPAFLKHKRDILKALH